MMEQFIYLQQRRYYTICNDVIDYIINQINDYGVTPILIVIGGSIPRGTFHIGSDVDIFSHHIEETECFSIPNIKYNNTTIQVYSEPISHTYKILYSNNYKSIDKYENLLLFPKIYDNTTINVKISTDEIYNKYHKKFKYIYNHMMYSFGISGVVYNKTAVEAIRSLLLYIDIKHNKRPNTIEILPLLNKYDIDIDLTYLYYNMLSYTKTFFWFDIISKILEFDKNE